MKKVILLALMFFSISAIASVTNAGFNFNAKVEENGTFELNINMKLPKKASLAYTFYDLFFNESNLLSISNELKKSNTNIDMIRALSTNGSSKFILTSEASKNGVTASIKNDCKLVVLNKQVKVDCHIKSSSTVLGDVFHFGTNSYNCEEQKNDYNCMVKITGRPVKVAIPFYYRSEERLAVSGIYNTVENSFKTFYHYGLEKELKEVSSEIFFQRNINGLWGKMIKFLKKEQELKGKLLVRSGDKGVSVSNM